jgi:PAS domain S-box-containing protein
MRASRRQRILLVEDEAIIALEEEQTLTRHGFEVEKALTGEDAVGRVLEGRDIDLVLMDIDLGRGMEGTEAARRILETVELPIVFLTSHAEREMVDKVKGITRYGYVLKSAGEFVLIEAINMAFELFDAQQRAEQSRRMYQRIFEQANDAIFINAFDDRILDVNQKACLLTGYSREELLTMTVPDIQAPEIRGVRGHVVREEIARYHTGVFKSVDLRRDGARVPVEVSTAPLDGNTVISVSRDIRDRVRVHDELKEVLHAMGRGVIFCAKCKHEEDFLILDSNRSARQIRELQNLRDGETRVSRLPATPFSTSLLELLRAAAKCPDSGTPGRAESVFAHTLSSGQIAVVFGPKE